jgi:hypothetical protein
MGILKRAAIATVVIGAGLAAFYVGAGEGWFGRYEGPGKIEGKTIRQVPMTAQRTKQILFGDLHVHTTFSTDAFLTSIPMLQGQGSHPPADAVDFARYCSALDFWSLTDHAEGLTPQRWKESVATVRQANAMSGDPQNPDTVVFMGWEWTNISRDAAEHYGHKNVVMRDLDPLPARPIASLGPATGALATLPPLRTRANMALFGPGDRQRYFDMNRFQRERAGLHDCPAGIAERDLPEDCFEGTKTPKELFAKLDDWGMPAMVIPHGNTWGLYTPLNASWDKQLKADQNDPKYQFLVEIYSGHGNSEEYRDWRPVTFDAAGKAVCPEARADYTPECRQAGEIIRDRCLKAGETAQTCDDRAAEARALYLQFGIAGFRIVPGQVADDWSDSGQCRDCYRPAFGYRPMSSAQYALALTNFDDPAKPKHFEFGFIGSSDNHQARPGTGYKQYSRADLTEAGGGPVSERWRSVLSGSFAGQQPQPKSVTFEIADSAGFALVNTERGASFMMTGGLVAVHAKGRDRQSIWDALEAKESYATSGDRMLLWFDLLNGAKGETPMGAVETFTGTPKFRVRAVGAFKQKPGCPEDSLKALSKDRLDNLCRGECYNPGDERKLITRIEIIKVRPQTTPNEPMAGLIQDPWKKIDCAPDQAGCTIEFEDPDYASSGRPATYYARAIEEPRLAINAANLRCERNAEGVCIKVNPCYSDYRTPHEENCLAMSEEKAWSSPIYLYPGAH